MSKDEARKLLKVIKMTDLVAMVIEDAVEDAQMKEKKEIARRMLKRNTPIYIIAEDTGLDESTIKELQAELNK